MAENILRIRTYEAYNPYQEWDLSECPWNFTIRWQDEARFEAWINQGFADKELAILGPPQVTTPGIRLLAPIIEMAQTLETIRQHGLKLPTPSILAPIHINAWANNVEIEDNKKMAGLFHQLAINYFYAFHPKLAQELTALAIKNFAEASPNQPIPNDLPIINLKTDQPEGVTSIAQAASQLKDQLSAATIEALLGKAVNHANGQTDLLKEKVTGYLLAHYTVYGWLNLPEYYPITKPTLYQVPQSEAQFDQLMEDEVEQVKTVLPETQEPDLENQGLVVVGFSDVLRSAHYYPHQGEPSLSACKNRWPTLNQLSRVPRLNGLAREEILKVIALIETDIGGKQNIEKLQQEVLEPLTDQLIELTYS